MIEDDNEVRRSLTLMLRARGCSLEVYESGIELLATGYVPDVDCLIIDYKMPKIDGLKLLGRLRQEGISTPALLLTGFYSAALEKKAFEAGYARVLEKPVLADHLMEIIHSESLRAANNLVTKSSM
ncbi:MAG: response regulator [Pseudomonadota bacterium]